MSQNYNLTKNELEMMTRLLGVAQIYEDTLRAVTQSYKAYLLDIIFVRLEIKPIQFKNAIVNIQTGELIIDEPKEPKKNEVQK